MCLRFTGEYPKASVINNYRNKEFNYRLSRARQTVKCTFGILSARFRVFKHTFECKLETVDIIVFACCVLHNYLRTQKFLCSNVIEDIDAFEAPIKSNNQFHPLRKTNTRSSNEFFLIWEKFKDFYNSPQGSDDCRWKRALITQFEILAKVFVLPRVAELLNHKKLRGWPLLDANKHIYTYYTMRHSDLKWIKSMNDSFEIIKIEKRIRNNQSNSLSKRLREHPPKPEY